MVYHPFNCKILQFFQEVNFEVDMKRKRVITLRKNEDKEGKRVKPSFDESVSLLL